MYINLFQIPEFLIDSEHGKLLLGNMKWVRINGLRL